MTSIAYSFITRIHQINLRVCLISFFTLLFFISPQTIFAQDKPQNVNESTTEKLRERRNRRGVERRFEDPKAAKLRSKNRKIMANYLDDFDPDPLNGAWSDEVTTGTSATGLVYTFTSDGDGGGGIGFAINGNKLEPVSSADNQATNERITIESRDGKAFVFNSMWIDINSASYSTFTIKGIGPEPFSMVTGGPGTSSTYSPPGGPKLVTRVEIIAVDFYFDWIDDVNVELDVQGAGLYGNSNLIVNGDDSPSTADYTDFGSTSPGSPIDRTFTIKNLGDATLTLSGNVLISGSGFSITSQPSSSTIPVGGQKTFVARFNPTGSGVVNGTITVNNNSEANPYTFSVKGTGTGAPEIAVTGGGNNIADGGTNSPAVDNDTDFGTLSVASGSNSNTFTITNSGNATLSLTDNPRVTIGGANAGDFTLTADAATSVAAGGGTTTFTVTFDPTAPGERNATVSIANTDSDENPFNFNLKGTGTAPEINITGNNVSIPNGASPPSTTNHTDFGTVNIASGTYSRTFTIENSGNEALNLIGPGDKVTLTGTHAGDFSVTLDATTPVASGGGTSTFTVEFDPSAAGTRSATVNIANSDSDENPYSFDIQGSGILAPTVTTNNASSINTTGATLNGSVNANNASTTVTFEYGTDTNYGTSVTAGQSPVTGITSTAVNKTLTGLIPNTTYHYKVVGSNSEGTVNGLDKTFTTGIAPPTVISNAATSVVFDGATLNGTVNANNTSTTVTFEYGTTTSYGTTVTADQSPVTGITTQPVSKAITGLLPNVTYHYRLVGVNGGGTEYGADMTFSTPVPPPVTTTNAADNITPTTATLNGTVNPNNDAATVTFEYGTDTNYGSTVTATQSPVSGTSNTSVSKGITGLVSNTTYHYRVVAQNSGGTNYGADMTFTSGTAPPLVTTDAATSVTSGGATLNGTVNANNASTTVTFEYGTTTSYGTTVTADQSPVGGLTNATVSKTIAGLTPNTTYHYRVVGNNGGGLTNGLDETFLTEYATPTTQASSVTPSAVGPASFNANWTSGNGTARAVFVKQDASGNAAPDNKTTYSANPIFGAGSQIGSTGWYCVFNGTGDNVTVEGLTPNTIYRTMVVEYNGTAGREQYITTATTGNPANATTEEILINEIDANTVSTDDKEFIELYDGGVGNVSLTGLVVVLFNGNGDVSYRAMDLDGKTTDGSGYFVLGNSGVAGVDLTFPNSTLQNGADGVGLYTASSSDFPNGTLVTADNLIDAIVYDTGQGDDTALIGILTPGQEQRNEDRRNDTDNHSLQRLPNGTGGLRNTINYNADRPTPGAENKTTPDMYLKGNGNAIADGSTTPLTANDTDFGNVDVSIGNKTNTFTIENNGLGTLNISGTSPYVTLSGTEADQFSVTQAPSNSVAASGTTTFDIKFAPTSAGEKTATVTINSDDPTKGTYDFKIKGTGIVPEINVKQGTNNIADGSGNYNFGGKDVGSDTDIVFTIENLGAGSMTLNNVTLSGADAGQFSIQAQPVSPVAGSGSTTFTVRFSPTSYGVKTATASFAHNDTDENPFDFTIIGTGLAPEVVVKQGASDIADDTGSYDYGNNDVGTNTDVVFTIENIGTKDLTLSNVSLSGANANQFSIQAQPTTPVAGPGNTSFTIRFTPTTYGTKTATVTFTHNDADENPFNFTITGTGLEPEINVKENGNVIADGTGLFDFGNKNVGTNNDQVFTIENIGNKNLILGSPTLSGANADQFSIEQNPVSPVAGPGSTTFTVRFTPTTYGTKTAEVSFTNNDANEAPFNFTLNGTGLEPEIVVKEGTNDIADGTGSYNYGSKNVGTNTDVVFTIENIGNADLNLGNVTLSGANADQFNVEVQPSTPVAGGGGTTTFTVRFTPTTYGVKTATATFTQNDADENPFDFTLTGTGLEPEIVVKQGSDDITDGTGSYDYGNKDVGTNTDAVFTIENIGNLDLNVSNVTLSGANADQFNVEAQPSTPVAGGGGTTTFTVRFTPTTYGIKTATATFTQNDADENPFDFTITGTGLEPEINVKENGNVIADGTGLFDFGNKNVGTNNDQVFTIENIGNKNLTLGSPTLSGANADQFSIEQNPVSPVAGSGSTTFTVRFTPTTYGAKTAEVSFTNNDANEAPFNFTLNGTGLEPEIVVKEGTNDIADGTGSYNYGSKDVGTNTDVVFTIENIGNADLNLSNVTLSGANADQFNVEVQPSTPVTGGGGTTTFTVRFTPTTYGVKTATATFTQNDADENPFDFTLTGTGLEPEIVVRHGATNIADGTGSFDFSSYDAGTTDEQTFTIENIGNKDLTLSNVTLSGANANQFSVTAQPASPVAGPGSTTFKIQFAPTTKGVKTATATFTHNDADENPYNFTVTGTGLEPEINLKEGVNNITDGGSYDFGNKSRLTHSDVVFTIENLGDTNLDLGGAPIITLVGADAGEFSVQAQPTTPIAPAGNTTFTLRYSPTTLGAKMVTIAIANDDLDENPYNLTITGTGINVPPVLANIEVTDLVYTENSGPVSITETITVADDDDTHIESAVVQITTNYINGEDELEFTDTGTITGTWDVATGKMTLNGSDTKANYETALRNVKYKNDLDNPTPLIDDGEKPVKARSVNATPRTVSFTIFDGDDNSNTETRIININAVNDNPEIKHNGLLTVDEGSTTVIYEHTLLVTDPDGKSHLVYTLITAPSHGMLKVDDVDVPALGTFTQKDINGWKLSYEHDGSETASDQFVFEVADNDRGKTPVTTFNITINTSNDKPLLTSIEDIPLRYLVNSPPKIVTNTVEIVDGDNTELQGATVAIGSYVNGDDLLALAEISGITQSFDEANGVLTLTGSAALSVYQDALRSIYYINRGRFITTDTQKLISFVVTDGLLQSDPAARTIDVEMPPTNQFAGVIAPTEIQVRYGRNNTITVRWTDNSNNEYGFVIYREVVGRDAKTSSVTEYEMVGIVGEDITEFEDTNVVEGEQYRYKVVAYNESGVSPGDGNESGITESLFPPSELEAVMNEFDQVVLIWTDNSGLEDGFIIERNDGQGYNQIAQVDADVTTYTDQNVTPGGICQYRIKAFNSTSESSFCDHVEILITGIEELDEVVPVEYELSQNYPNPFNPTTTIRYGAPGQCGVKIDIYNLIGEKITTLVDEVKNAGYHETVWNAESIASGIYVYIINFSPIDGKANLNIVKKMIVLK